VHDIALDLLILLAAIWLVAVTLRPLGLPTVMGELIVGVVVGPAVFGLIEPSAAIQLLAEIGIFFLMFHAGLETQPGQFYDALKRSMGVAVVGAVVPFGLSFAVASACGLDVVGATFVGLTMTATAVVITLKSLKDLGLANTRVARVIIASCVIDDLLTLVFFGLVIGVLSGGDFEPLNLLVTVAKVTAFFGVAVLLGRVVYPHLTLPFRAEGGKGFTFVLLTAIAAGLFAEAIGLHMILGAYMAGLFFDEKVAHPNLVKVVADRAYGIAYSFLGPIFFISLGFSITFDISGSALGLLALLTTVVIVGQILSAGGMALRMGLPPREALTVGVGMCGRAELAFILASLALAQGAIDQPVFSVLIFTAFLLNVFTPLGLKGCAVLLEGKAARTVDATRGVLQIDKFGPVPAEERADGRLPQTLPNVDGAVVIYGCRRGAGPCAPGRGPRPGGQRTGRPRCDARAAGTRARLRGPDRRDDRRPWPQRGHAARGSHRGVHAAPRPRCRARRPREHQDRPARDRGAAAASTSGGSGAARARREPAGEPDARRGRDRRPHRCQHRRPVGG
jgi:Kef-type K+ transport system membrane component KefB